MSNALLPWPLMDGTVPSEAALAAVQAHPAFDQACYIVAAGMVARNRGNRLVNAVMTDRVRILMSISVLHFHFSSRPGDPRGLANPAVADLDCPRCRAFSSNRRTLSHVAASGLLLPSGADASL